MFKQNQQSKIFPRKLVIIPAGALLGALGLISALFIVSDFASSSYALDGTNLQSEVTAEIDGTHYVTLSASDVTFSITPTNSTASDKKQVDVELSTNVSGGASLYLSTSSSKNALYLNGDTNSTSQHIASASSTTTYDNMVNNTWAYSTDDINYQGVPTLDSPVLLSDIDGISTGTNTNGVVSATIPIYYAAKVDTSIPSGSYANSVTYLAVVDGGITTSATLTKITVDNQEVDELQADKTNVILVTTNLKTKPYGTPRVYYETTAPSGYAECGDVVVSSSEAGYMTVQCSATPTQAATGVTLHIVPKGSSEDTFCTDGTYEPNSSECEAGEWKWGSFTVSLPNIKGPVFNGIKTMQEMTPQICADAQENDTTMLEDARDGKMYWVAKLADSNCWMTQNLELDLSTSTPLTSELSDVTSSWTPTSNTYTSAQDGSNSDYVAQSWNLGKYVWKTPNSSNYCNPDTGFSDSSCAPYWQDVSNMTPMTAPRADGISVEGNTYDAHYLAGNYYSWDAATANSVGDTGTATQSICPKGFELPLHNGDKSYNSLISAYDIAVGAAMSSAPLFFVRSGLSLMSYYYLYNAGRDGGYWSSHTNSSSHAFYLSLTSSYVLPSDRITRESGLSVRCVAPSA